MSIDKLKDEKGHVELGSDNEITITNLIFKSSDVYSLLEDKENREEWIEKALIIGSIGIKNMIVGFNLDYVDKKFNEFSTKIDNFFSINNTNSVIFKLYSKIEETFNEKNKDSPIGKLVNYLEEYFNDKDGGKIKKLFDPNNENSPIYNLKNELTKELSDQIKEIQNELIKQRVERGIIETTPKKGIEFEELVKQDLGLIVNPYLDKFEYVGNILGNDNNKKGDFVISVNIGFFNKTKKIVVECKNQYISENEIYNELYAAKKNRGAEFGIFLFKNQDQMPESCKPLKMTNDIIITSYENLGLFFAYRVLRAIIEVSLEKEIVNNNINIGDIQEKLKDLFTKSNDIKEISKEADRILATAEDIKEKALKIYNEIEDDLKKIEDDIKIKISQ